MTLVVTTLPPSIEAHNGSVLGMFPQMKGELVTVVLGFVISASAPAAERGLQRRWLEAEGRRRLARILRR
jgi:hypothetical protein